MGLPPIPTPDTLKGIDDLIRLGFEEFRELWFSRLLISTALVVAGLLFEAPEIWHESIEAIRELCHSCNPRRDIPAWMKLAGTLGWVLIVVGVTGEFVADSFVSKADGFVQKFDEILLADSQRKSGFASERAASAFERAAQTEREASQENERAAQALNAAEAARREAEGFKLQIAQANERASANEREAEHLRKDAEQERLERMRLEAAVAPRTLSLDQQRQIRDACLAFRGHNASVFSYATDGEGALLGGQIIAALAAAGINIADDRASAMSTGGFDLGIHVRGPPSEEQFMECLKQAFTSIGHLTVAPINDPVPRMGSGMFGGGQQFSSGTVFVNVIVGIKPVSVLLKADTKTSNAKAK
jgi:hypothetical protein